MAEPNPFDRFDPLPVAPLATTAPAALSMVPAGFQAMAQPAAKEPNFFDQFDEPAPGATPAKPQLDAAGDIGGGIVHGLVNAVTGFLGGPGTLQQAERGAAGNALERNGYPNAAAVARAVPALPSGADLNDMVACVMGRSTASPRRPRANTPDRSPRTCPGR